MRDLNSNRKVRSWHTHTHTHTHSQNIWGQLVMDNIFIDTAEACSAPLFFMLLQLLNRTQDLRAKTFLKFFYSCCHVISRPFWVLKKSYWHRGVNATAESDSGVSLIQQRAPGCHLYCRELRGVTVTAESSGVSLLLQRAPGCHWYCRASGCHWHLRIFMTPESELIFGISGNF